MGFWQNLKTALSKWFLHDTASANGVSLNKTPAIPQPQSQPATQPDPAGNTGIVPPNRTESPPPVQIEIQTTKATAKKAAPKAEPDVIDNTLKVLNGVVKIAKDSGLLAAINSKKELPSKGKTTKATSSDDEESEDDDSDEPIEVNDSSEVVD